MAARKKPKPKAKATPRAPRKPPCRTTAYARAVVAGEVVTNRLVRLACERHLKDLETGHQRGLVWSQEKADFAIGFFEDVLKLNGGEHEGKPFLLQPWQAFIVGCLFGWLGPDGYRRFRSAYLEIGKGNGKSPLVAGVGLFCLVADGEPRAEVYAAATKKDQAQILFRDAVAMVEQSPDLAAVIEKTGPTGRVWNLAHHASGSWFRPIASDENSQSGPRPHCALIDEVHEHRTAAVIDMMHKGTKGRRQALILEITNSGSDRTTVCWQHHEYSVKVLEALQADDAWFAFVCGLDACEHHRAEGQVQPIDGCPDCDDYTDEAVWPKANPNLGVSVTLRYLREQVTTAKGMPASEGECRRLNFCFWTQVASRCIPAEKWIACTDATVTDDAFRGRECVGSLDIGATSDFCAFARLFGHGDASPVEIPDPEDPEAPPRVILRQTYSAIVTFWLPEAPVKRDERTAAMIEGWRRAGLVRTTPGSMVDYGLVFADIVALARATPFRRLAIDQGFQGNWIAGQLMGEFGEDVVKAFRQGILSMNPPFREFLDLVKSGRFKHGGHPVLTWMAGNCAAEVRSGLMKPSKDHSPEKIDGITALVMGLGLALVEPPPAGPEISWI